MWIVDRDRALPPNSCRGMLVSPMSRAKSQIDVRLLLPSRNLRKTRRTFLNRPGSATQKELARGEVEHLARVLEPVVPQSERPFLSFEAAGKLP